MPEHVTGAIRTPSLIGAAFLLVLALGGCDALTNSRRTGTGSPATSTECLIPESEIREGCEGKDCIQSLDEPELVAPEAVTYLSDSSRVVGLEIEEQEIAVAHNVLRWHEIVNLTVGTRSLAVTYCPLTGSALVFDRETIEGRELGVSGLLFKNNLIMYDRTDDPSDETLWTQMRMKGDCGQKTGATLPVVEAKEMQWGVWRQLHPETVVVSDDGGSTGQYRQNEYRSYEQKHNSRVPFPLSGGMDERRPPKERVLGIPVGNDFGLAFPFDELRSASTKDRAAAASAVDGRYVVVFWDRKAQAADAFFAELDGSRIHFDVEEGRFVDSATRSTWNLEGEAVDGPLTGTQLEPVTRSYVAFWFAWAAFQQETSIWTAEN